MDEKFYPSDPKEWDYGSIEKLMERKYEEDTYTEFKAHLHYPEKSSKSRTEWRHNLEREFTAFANAYGGFIIFGLNEGDDGLEPWGVEAASDIENHISHLLQDTVPTVRTETSNPIDAPGDNRIILIVKVLKAQRKPVKTSDSAYYVRLNSEKHPMTQEQLQAMFVERDRRQQNVRQLELEIARFLEAYREHFKTGNYHEATPQFYAVDVDTLREVVRANSHLYADENLRGKIVAIMTILDDIVGEQSYYEECRANLDRSPYQSLDQLNKQRSKDFDGKVNRLKELFEQLVEHSDLNPRSR